MSPRLVPFLAVAALLATGCSRIENGFRYEYAGRILKPDGKGAHGVAVRLARVDAPEAPDLSGTKIEKEANKYVDKSVRVKTNSDGHYLGALETVRGWGYDMIAGSPTGSTQAPLPPILPEVILYFQEPKSKTWVGYRVPVPPENQTEAYPRVRKIRLPDMIYTGKGEPLVLPGSATTKPTPLPSVPVPG